MSGTRHPPPARLLPARLPRSRLAHDASGVVALEFAIVGPMLVFLLVAVIEISLLGWTQVVLQLTASQTARCLGIGSSACSNPTQFAVSTAATWLYSNAVSADNVTLETNVTCSSAPGHYARVTITSQFVGSVPLPGILGGGSVTAKACYFTGT